MPRRWIFFSASLLLAIVFAACVLGAPGGTAGRNAPKAQTPPAETHSWAILVDLDVNRLFLLRDGSPYKSFSCATGSAATPSPLGSFHIVRKSHWGEGFGGYWLGLDCPWGNYGIHGTTNPDSVGLRVSHGCFRMRSEDIAVLYPLVSVGTPVAVTSGSFGPFGTGFRTIEPGMYGLDVQVIQERLTELGFYHGKCNGRYDAAGFREAVHRFQKANGLTVSDNITKKAARCMGFVFMD